MNINKIPSQWHLIKLGKLGEFKNGINKSKDDFGYGIPFVNLMDVFGKSKIISQDFDLVNANEDEIKAYSLLKGDVLFIRSSVKPTGVGLTALVDEDLVNTVYSGFLIRFREAGKLEHSFKRYCFHSLYFRHQVIKKSTISANTNINQDSLSSLNLLIPPIEQQKKIAEILTTWDEAIALTEKAIKAKYYFKQTIKKKLLERKFKNYQEDNKINDWMIKKLDDVAIFQNGKAHENYVVEDGKFIIINSKFISTEGKVIKYSDKQLLPLKKDDIVMVMSDVPNGKALAKFFYIEEDNKFTLNQRICLLRTKNINSRYLFYFLDKNQYFLSFDNGVGQTNLRKDEVLSCPILVPPVAEQEKIANLLQCLDKEINKLEKQLGLLKTQKQGLMQKLLTGEWLVPVPETND